MSTIIGILSDTHGALLPTQKARDIFQSNGVSEVIHCGDVGKPGVVNLLSAFPTHYVVGNCDTPSEVQSAVMKYGGTFYDALGMIVREEIKIAFLHGHDWRTFDELIDSGRYDLICYGHTHEADWRIQHDTHLLNPGALFRTSSPSVALLELPSLRLRTVRIH